MLYRAFFILFIAAILFPSASATVTGFYVTPENPVVGDTITISGTASPNESVKVIFSFEKPVTPSDGIYLYRIYGIDVPSGSNSFTVTASDVNDLYVGLLMSLWVTKSADAIGNIATLSHSNLVSGIYDAKIYGTPMVGTSQVILNITAVQNIDADANGGFVYGYSTNSMPVGDFQLNVGGLTRTITLGDPGSDGGSSGGGTSGGGTSGGGTSGGGTSGEDFENILISETQREYVAKGSKVSYGFHLDGNIVRYINFTGLTYSGTIASKVEILNHTSSLVDCTPSDIVYKNLNVWDGNMGWFSETNVKDPTIMFMVDRSWVNNNGIILNTISFYSYNDVTNNWEKMSIQKIGEDSNSYYFKASLPIRGNLGPMAISGRSTSAPVPPFTTIKPTITPQPKPEIVPGATPVTWTGIWTEEVPGFHVLTALFVLIALCVSSRRRN